MVDFLQNRQALEARERSFLASYAVLASASRGRRYDEDEHPRRTCFQRDRDRVIHSAAFRRLEAKTQVFLGEKSDYCRTRLTHTIEVAQIARTMARILAVNEDLAEAVALAHDLGHGPYGHCGEAVLNELMAGHGGFEHNRQSLRLVEYLEHPYPKFRGLNLTFETRWCLAKHETRYDHPEETAEYGPGWAPLEGQIADLADAIAYNSHDLDDALACGLIEESDLADVVLYETARQSFERDFPATHRFARQLRCAKAIIDILITDAVEETGRRLQELKPRDVADVCQAEEKVVALSGRAAQQLAQLEEFLMERVYHHRQVVDDVRRAETQLRALFGAYLENPSLLPERYRQRFDEQGVHRVICDYLAGMTDRFCRQSYARLLKG